jgi:hypothetical protein
MTRPKLDLSDAFIYSAYTGGFVYAVLQNPDNFVLSEKYRQIRLVVSAVEIC